VTNGIMAQTPNEKPKHLTADSLHATA
jgi:hypothetical protein